MTGQALVVQADALRLPLPDASVDLVITSPPYFALRAYDAGPGQLGSEPTPQAYLAALWQATAEMARVLRPSGSIFVNLGDKYSGGNGAGNTRVFRPGKGSPKWQADPQPSARPVPGFPPKSLLLLPERYRIGCVDHLGLIARAVIVWGKPNGLPESVTDRVRRSHEDWVHLTKQPRYYAAVDEIRQEHEARPQRRYAPMKPRRMTPDDPETRHNGMLRDEPGNDGHPLGKLPGSVWSIPSEPLRLPDHLGVDHYAAFPSEWPRRLILGWSPPGICVACGQGRWPVVERSEAYKAHRAATGMFGNELRHEGNGRRPPDAPPMEATILGYACACTPHTNHPGTGERALSQPDRWKDGPQNGGGFAGQARDAVKTGPWREYHLAGWTPPPTRPAVILDPFAGTGTVAMVARALGRIGISIDLSSAYGRAAKWRIRHDAGKAISRTWTERQGSLL